MFEHFDDGAVSWNLKVTLLAHVHKQLLIVEILVPISQHVSSDAFFQLDDIGRAVVGQAGQLLSRVKNFTGCEHIVLLGILSFVASDIWNLGFFLPPLIAMAVVGLWGVVFSNLNNAHDSVPVAVLLRVSLLGLLLVLELAVDKIIFLDLLTLAKISEKVGV